MGHSQSIDFKISDGGSPIADEVRESLVQITVDDMLDAAAVATVKLRDPDGVLSSGTKFKIGNELKIELGYVGSGVTEVFKGEITGWKGAFVRRGGQTLTIVAQDKFHRLRRNRQQKTFLNMKDSAAVQQAATAAGITATVEDTGVNQDAISQWNQSDADFILQRANVYGFECFYDGTTLQFRKPKLDGAAAVTLEWHKKLKSFTVALSLEAQQKDVKVSSWDMVQKAPVTSSVAKGQERSMMGGTVQGAKAAEDGIAAGTTWFPRVDAAVTQAHVDAFAKGLFAKRSEKFVTGEGSCEGDAAVRRGTVVQIDGIGNYLAGPYYVTRAIHTVLIGSGYTTTFKVKRTAVKAPAAPPQKQETSHENPRPEPVTLLDPNWEPPGGIIAEVLVPPTGIGTSATPTSTSVLPGVDGEPPVVGDEVPETQTIRFKLEDQDGTPLGGKPFELVIAGLPPITGVTGADGYVIADVPADAQTGELTFWLDADKSGESYTWPLRIADHTG
jgi:uncharacterized protein